MTSSLELQTREGIGTAVPEATHTRPHKAAARVAGVLFLISYASFIAGEALVTPFRDVGHDLAVIHTQSGQLVTGVVLEFGNVAAIVGFAVVLLPYLRRGGEALAHGYVAMRVLEGAAYLIAGIATSSLITLSEEYVAAGSPGAGGYRAAQAFAVGQSTWAVTIAFVPFAVGAVVLYVLLYRTRLVPRFIAVWGLVAVALVATFNLLGADVTEFGPAVLLVAPIILNEFFLAGWLIVKGFDETALTPSDAPAADGAAGAGRSQ
jgi:hypothetical protein